MTRSDLTESDLLIRHIIDGEMYEDQLIKEGIDPSNGVTLAEVARGQRIIDANKARWDRPFPLIRGIKYLVFNQSTGFQDKQGVRCDPYSGWPITLEWACRTCGSVSVSGARCRKCGRVRR